MRRLMAGDVSHEHILNGLERPLVLPYAAKS